MADIIDKIFFQKLSGENPREVCKRALCSYDDSERCYTLDIWGEPFRICPDRYSVSRIRENHEPLHFYFDLFAVHYLLFAREIDPENRWISEKDIPGGATFFRGPHDIPTHLITERFNNDIPAFSEACRSYGGEPADLADAAFVFWITPRIPVAVLYWEGDDLFSPESKLLFDRTIADQLALDVIYALAVGVCKRVGYGG